jgi:tetratricopeptide (TPR) repeat protein
MLLALPSFASELFDKGLKAANEKKYTEAIIAFEEVVEHEKFNVSAYYNLGNCYYHLRKYGKAIWAFEKVLKLNPRDAEAPMSLELCYNKIGPDNSWTPHTGGLQRLICGVGSSTWSYLSIFISICLGLTVFGLFRLSGTPWKRLLFMAALGEAVLLIAFVIAASSAYDYTQNDRFAIVTGKSAPTYLNDLGERSDLDLTEGTKVEVIGLTKTKLEVMLHDGHKVLVSPEAVARI